MLNSKKYRILFVCLGNICRSPSAEGIMRKQIKEANLEDFIELDSAGTSGWHRGELPDKRMRQHGAKRGYNFDSHSRQFTSEDFDDFDLIVVMDDSNYHNIMAMSLDVESQKKVHRMTDYLQRLQHDHIPDPYYMGADGFEQVLDLLEDACEGLLKHLNTNNLHKMTR